MTNNQPDQHKTRGPNAKPLQESANIKFVVLKVQEVYRKIKKIINIGNYSKDLTFIFSLQQGMPILSIDDDLINTCQK